MAVEAASSRLTEPEELLAATLAASSTWQTLTGAANAAAALTSIYFDSIPDIGSDDSAEAWDEYKSLLPFGLVTTAGDGFRLQANGVNYYSQSGTLGLTIEAEITAGSATTDEERGRWWKNRLGDIVTEMVDLNHSAGYLTIDSIAMVDFDFGPPEQDMVKGFTLGRAAFVLTYGGSS